MEGIVALPALASTHVSARVACTPSHVWLGSSCACLPFGTTKSQMASYSSGKICPYFRHGYCWHGSKCWDAHVPGDIRLADGSLQGLEGLRFEAEGDHPFAGVYKQFGTVEGHPAFKKVAADGEFLHPHDADYATLCKSKWHRGWDALNGYGVRIYVAERGRLPPVGWSIHKERAVSALTLHYKVIQDADEKEFAEFSLLSVEAIGKEDLPPLDNVLPLAEAEGDDFVLCRDVAALVLKSTRWLRL